MILQHCACLSSVHLLTYDYFLLGHPYIIAIFIQNKIRIQLYVDANKIILIIKLCFFTPLEYCSSCNCNHSEIELTLESGIDVGQLINVGPGKFGKKNKRRALNTHVLCTK